MNIDWELVVEVIKALAWPIVVTIALYLLRSPLVELVTQIARRARKLSVFEVSVELAILPELQSSWSVGSADPRRLTSAQIFDSASQTLFQELLKSTHAEYAIVDLRSGDAWLTSRLFVFALILGEVTGLRAFVFLENVGGIRRRFLGVATPANVRRALGRCYPWLEEAFAKALINNYPFKTGESGRVTNFVKKFIEELQHTTAPPKNESKFFLEMETEPKKWEQTSWIDGECLENDLIGFLEYSWVEESPDISRSALSEAVIRRNASFVALVDSDRRFKSLVDRYALLSEMSLMKNSAKKDID